MSCPNAAGAITSSALLDVSITDRSAALPTAVPDVLLFCEHFMARHILCFHITDKFVLSLSHWPLLDSVNDVVQLRELALLQSNLEARGGLLARMCTNTGHLCDTPTCINMQKHMHTQHLSNHWLTYQVKRTDFLARMERGGKDGSNLYLWEFYPPQTHCCNL